MSNEVTVNASLNVRKVNLIQTRSANGAFDLNAASPAVAAGTKSIGFAAHEAIALGSVATPGWAYFKNVDATNYIQLGTDSSGAFIAFAKLKPGEFCILRLATAAPYAKANTAAVKLTYEIYDD
jgi:hypothetical protein